MAEESGRWSVAVVGAGPAGLFAARELSNHGADVFLFNRDIKPGGLAEYGIFPDKLRMKDGIRAQIFQIIGCSNIHYFGNVTVGEDKPLTLNGLWKMGFSAILVTSGAQGTKWLGLPGERLPGAYHAKEVVYNYNHLPPYSEMPLKIGKRAVIIGVGNVMADVARYLIHHMKIEEVTAVARRGPAEVKFDRKELESFVNNIDLEDFDAEIRRVAPVMLALGQDPNLSRKLINDAMEKGLPKDSDTKFRMRFLYSPTRIFGNESMGVEGLEVEENTLIQVGEDTKARGLGSTQLWDVDTVIFAIGDRVDEMLGLPLNGSEYVKSAHPRYPVEGTSFEVMDPKTNADIPGVFVAGWSRNASAGVVGIARRDGVQCAQAIVQYLKERGGSAPIDPDEVRATLREMGYVVVEKEMLGTLYRAEKAQAERLGLPEFKFDTNEAMLNALSDGVPETP